jgi:hypothetical protein
MLLMIWKYAFFIKPYSSCNSRIYLSQCQDSGATFEKKSKRKKREEKVRRERERKGQVSY